MKCGYVANDKNQEKTCPGPVYVSLRDEGSDAITTASRR